MNDLQCSRPSTAHRTRYRAAGAVAELLDVPEPDVVTVHLLSAPVRLACPVLPGGAATPSARCAGPAPRRPAAAPPPGRLLAGASGRTRPGTPAARRSPPRSSAAGRPGFRGLRPGWRGRPGAVGVPGGGPSVGPRRRTLRSARRVKSGPRRAGDGRPRPGAAGPGNGERGKAPRAGCAAGRGLAGGPALPEGKAGRGGRGVVPGGDLRRALAVAGGGGGRPWCRPAGRAGLPPGTAGIHPPLRPPRQVRPARCRAGLAPGPEPRAGAGRYPPRQEGTAPHEGRPPGGYREGGTVARTAKVRATVVHAPATGGQPGTGAPGLRAARYAD